MALQTEWPILFLPEDKTLYNGEIVQKANYLQHAEKLATSLLNYVNGGIHGMLTRVNKKKRKNKKGYDLLC